MQRIILFTLVCFSLTVHAQSKFDQLENILPTGSDIRTSSGAPGHNYWQQKVDYDMQVEIDEENNKLYGKETITYHNQSPDVLTYVWLQLDQNYFSSESASKLYNQEKVEEKMSLSNLSRYENNFDGGHKITSVKSLEGKDLNYFINQTMMRIDLPKPLAKGEKVSFKIDWWYNITNTQKKNRII